MHVCVGFVSARRSPMNPRVRSIREHIDMSREYHSIGEHMPHMNPRAPLNQRTLAGVQWDIYVWRHPFHNCGKMETPSQCREYLRLFLKEEPNLETKRSRDV